jgi:hypothetical protein
MTRKANKLYFRNISPTLTTLGALGLITFMGMQANAQTVIITQWSFTTVVAAPDNSPAATTGTGTAVSLGMTNTFTYAGTTATNSVTNDDILSSPGLPSGITEDTWRIRGVYQSTGVAPNNGTVTKSANVNGWNLSAPQFTQGAEFDESTVGYTGITASFDWMSTAQGVRDLQEEYTTDGSTWITINPVQVAVPGDFITPTIDLTGISAANNDPTFGIRLVSAYDPTYSGAGDPTYTSATLVSGAPVQYNNSSGNWRFDNITINGTAITAAPEPSGAVSMLLGASLLGSIAVRRRRKGSVAL